MSEEDYENQYEEEYPDEYEEEIEDYATEDYPSSDPTIKKIKSYDVLDLQNVERKSKEAIEEVISVLGLPTKTSSTTLLRHYKWDKAKLIQEFTGTDSTEVQDNILREAGITTFELEKPLSEEDKDKLVECLICLEDVLGRDTFALACGHRYCRLCWKQYLEIQITTDAACIWTRCPYPKCNELVHENAFHTFVSPQLYSAYENYLNRSIVLENPGTKFCPAPSCGNAIQVDRPNRKTPVTCLCGFVWCFRCADFEVGDHIPASCLDLEAWGQKAQDESENVKWMIANTKKCPSCRSAIEKNGGCMHMTCRKTSGGCGHEFCWLCRGDWKEHGSHSGGYYSCNKYDAASGVKQEDDTAAQMKTEMERYQFFYTRYEAHRDAGKIADKQRTDTETKAGELVKVFRCRPEDTTFLRSATEQLIQNRGILKNSYIYGFYISKKSTPKELFEFNQEELEKHTNHLSELYEKPIDSIKGYDAFIDWKNETIKYTGVVGKYREKFVEAIVDASIHDKE